MAGVPTGERKYPIDFIKCQLNIPVESRVQIVLSLQKRFPLRNFGKPFRQKRGRTAIERSKSVNMDGYT